MKVTTVRGGHEVLDFEAYTQHLISVVLNKLGSLSSADYLARFSLGSIEMRTLASLAYQPDLKASEICSLIGIDKAAISRALTKLLERDLVIAPEGRQKQYKLSDSGWRLHEQFLELVKERQSALTLGLTEDELVMLTKMLRKLAQNVELLASKKETLA